MVNASKSIYLDDFGTGICAGFVSAGAPIIHVDRLDEALVKAYDFLIENSDGDFRFHISLDALHGDAPQARRAIGGAVSRGIGFFDDERLHIIIPVDYVKRYYEGLPLTEELWLGAARAALAHLGRLD